MEQRIGWRAGRQEGRITHVQLRALGLGADAIKYRARTGRLIREHEGVYRIAGAPDGPVGRAWSAVLACGEAALLSHGSAAVLWRLRHRWPALPEVTVRTARRRPGIRMHRSRTLTSADLRTFNRLPITSPARTLLDIAPRLDVDELERAVADSCAARHLRIGAMRELLARSKGVPGAARLALLIGEYVPSQSEFERAFRRVAKRRDFPRYVFQAPVGGYRVDVLFPAEKVIVELDGVRYHEDPGSFERDRKRDMRTAALGFLTVRITWIRLAQHAEEEAELLLAILASRRV